MGKTKIYISIPISGEDYKQQRRFADTVASGLSKRGYIPVNPFNIYAGHERDYWDHVCADLRALADCDAVMFLPGWERSLGCNIEHDFVMRCIAHGKKQYKVIYGGIDQP